MKTIVFGRGGNLSVGAHLREMRAWLAEREIVPHELSEIHTLNFQVVFRAQFEAAADADQFVEKFGL